MKGIKLVLFDVDDTLYDFERNWQHTVESVFLSHPLTSEFEQERICRLFNHYSQLHWDKTVSGELNFQQYRRLRLQETLEESAKRCLMKHLILLRKLLSRPVYLIYKVMILYALSLSGSVNVMRLELLRMVQMIQLAKN